MFVAEERRGGWWRLVGWRAIGWLHDKLQPLPPETVRFPSNSGLVFAPLAFVRRFQYRDPPTTANARFASAAVPNCTCHDLPRRSLHRGFSSWCLTRSVNYGCSGSPARNHAFRNTVARIPQPTPLAGQGLLLANAVSWCLSSTRTRLTC